MTAGAVAGSLARRGQRRGQHRRPPRRQRGLSPGTRFFVPPPSAGAPQQILQLLKSGDRKDAALITEMEATPRAVWFTSGTPAQVQQQVRQTMAEAAVERAVPVLVAYDIPGRDCAQYSAGGALSQADYQAWISGFAQGIGQRPGGGHPGAGRPGQPAVELRAAGLVVPVHRRRADRRAPVRGGRARAATRA